MGEFGKIPPLCIILFALLNELEDFLCRKTCFTNNVLVLLGHSEVERAVVTHTDYVAKGVPVECALAGIH